MNYFISQVKDFMDIAPITVTFPRTVPKLELRYVPEDGADIHIILLLRRERECCVPPVRDIYEHATAVLRQ